MTTRKILYVAFMGVLGLVLPRFASAVTLVVDDVIKLYDGPGTTAGGEFKADIVKDSATTDDFRTFCLETNEYFSYGESLTVVGISTYATNGGKGGQTVTEPNRDYLDSRTAYLFFLFSTGALGDYDYTNSVARVSDANALQNLIWYLEDEGVAAPVHGSQGDAWLDLATLNAGTGLWGVQVLNLKRSNGNRAQDQLYYAPVPEPANMILLGSGLLGLARYGRRKKK